MDNLTYVVELLEEGRVRVIISKDEYELGSLYFEKAKKSFQRKPIGMDLWACVDAKVESLYLHIGEQVLPKEVISKCHDEIRGAGY